MSLQGTPPKVYHYLESTFEWHHTSDARWDPLEVPPRPLVPGYATLIKPPLVEVRQAAIFNPAEESWAIVDDYRKVILWSKSTAKQVQAKLGDTPASLDATETEPTVEFPVWDEGKWTVDEDKRYNHYLQQAESGMARRRALASEHIGTLEDAIEIDGGDDDERRLLKEWKAFRVAVSRVPKQAGYPFTIDWPVEPK